MEVLMKKFIFLIMLLLPVLAYPQDQTSTTLTELALQGQIQETGFYLNSKTCSSKDNLHVAYHQKTDILIFGYFYPKTGVIKNYIWDRKKGETSTLSSKFDEVADPKKAVKISENEMKDSAIRFRTDWLTCR
jgi:hypothetical protein